MVHGKNRIPYWIDRRLTGLAGPEYHAIISFGLPIEPEDSQYGKSWLKGRPVADPFVVAAAKARGACAVTEESMRETAAKIPNVCDHFEIDWTNVEGFMKREGWAF